MIEGEKRRELEREREKERGIEGKGRETKAEGGGGQCWRQRGPSGDKSGRINPLDEASAAAPVSVYLPFKKGPYTTAQEHGK